MTRPLEDWADRKFNPDSGDQSHIVPFGSPYSLCGAEPLGLGGWWGTGDMDEIETAAALPLCPTCMDRIPSVVEPR